MRLSEFREEVHREFGDRLERATPANVHNFLSRMQARLGSTPEPGERIELRETATSYHEVISDFLFRHLELAVGDSEQAVIALWLLALELHFALVSEDYAERFARIITLTDLDTT